MQHLSGIFPLLFLRYPYSEGILKHGCSWWVDGIWGGGKQDSFTLPTWNIDLINKIQKLWTQTMNKQCSDIKCLTTIFLSFCKAAKLLLMFCIVSLFHEILTIEEWIKTTWKSKLYSAILNTQLLRNRPYFVLWGLFSGRYDQVYSLCLLH